MKIDQLYIEVNEIKKRNERVELDKAWETSWTRRVVVSLFTYIVIVLFFHFAGLPKPLVNAIVPAVAFIISTLSMPIIKRWWVSHNNR
ncbi:MAG: hypothetical protein ACD_66C00219G0004 [uncultured bacterium]|nr:MAG: hypothetical protein ACD_66C00219G0004 [uncultured bacterium]OGL94477.1 MAG: hypothetical protein A2258_01355 [Candidatus Uhrbacteria bacterium RIFOXYA2_FULL_41_8]OGL97128.1 MAG: hypothetical protein A2317_01290 [Candidatus Uhrbacteria bacterium RIFOXYB2_FULL_41_10]HAL50111.1 hypothetical protein [Candidatus Uhrbacteria bacterium]HBY02809.1 hypothetical protein [Rikenellaceae bacterium]